MSDNRIFTIGAFLEPLKIQGFNGKDKWVWVVNSFEDESFKDGEVFNPLETAESLEELLVDTTEN